METRSTTSIGPMEGASGTTRAGTGVWRMIFVAVDPGRREQADRGGWSRRSSRSLACHSMALSAPAQPLPRAITVSTSLTPRPWRTPLHPRGVRMPARPTAPPPCPRRRDRPRAGTSCRPAARRSRRADSRCSGREFAAAASASLDRSVPAYAHVNCPKVGVIASFVPLGSEQDAAPVRSAAVGR